MAEPSAGAESRTQIDDRGAGVRPRHAREAAREMGTPYADERGRMDRPGLGAMITSSPSAFALLAGVWLLVARLVFNYAAAGSAADGVLNGVVIGIAVGLIALALMASATSNPVLGFVIAVLGGWMIAAPWVFNYVEWGSGSGPTWSDVISGAVMVVTGVATWLAGTARQMGAMRRRPGMAM